MKMALLEGPRVLEAEAAQPVTRIRIAINVEIKDADIMRRNNNVCTGDDGRCVSFGRISAY